MRVSFRPILSGLLLAALASAPLGCGDDDSNEVDAGSADAGAEVAPPTSSDVTAEPASAPVEQAAQPR